MSNFKTRVPVIVLDADIRSQEGVIQSLGKHGVPVIAISHLEDCPAFYSKYVVDTLVSPFIDDGGEAYIEFLLGLPEKGVLVYSNDVSAVILARHQVRLLDAGFLLNLPSSENLEKVFDKYTCSQLADSFGISFPQTSLVRNKKDIESVWDTFQKPVIIKGTRMAGGQYEILSSLDEVDNALELVQGRVEAKAYRARESELMLQQFLEYGMTDCWHCETVYGQQSRPMGHFTIRHIRTSFLDNGGFGSRLFAGEHVFSQELIDMTDKLLTSMHWKGFANVDFIYQPKDKKFYLLEVNPRLPGFSFYPSRAGYEMAYLYYLDLIGETPKDVPDSYHSSIYFETLRSPGDFTHGIINILKGHMKIWPYVCSYFRILKPGVQKVIEPVRLEDMGFTLRTLRNDSLWFLGWISGYLKRKIFSSKR